MIFLQSHKTETTFQWTDEHYKSLKKTKNFISEDIVLASPDTRYKFHVHVEAFLTGVGSILKNFQPESW